MVGAGAGKDSDHLPQNHPSYFWLPCYSDGSLGTMNDMLKVTGCPWDCAWLSHNRVGVGDCCLKLYVPRHEKANRLGSASPFTEILLYLLWILNLERPLGIFYYNLGVGVGSKVTWSDLLKITLLTVELGLVFILFCQTTSQSPVNIHTKTLQINIRRKS